MVFDFKQNEKIEWNWNWKWNSYAAILAVVKAIQGNYVGAVGEVASGVFAFVPVGGTTVSYVIDGAMTAGDIDKEIDSFNVSK